MFFKTVALKNFAIFTGNNFMKKKFQHRCFSLNMVAASGHLHLLFLSFPISPFRSSHRKRSIKKLFLMFWNIHKKRPWSLFFIKYRAEAYIFIKKRLQHRCFPVDIATFLRTYLFWRKSANGYFSPFVILFVHQ